MAIWFSHILLLVPVHALTPSAGNLQLGILGSNFTHIVCQFVLRLVNSALQYPRLPAATRYTTKIMLNFDEQIDGKGSIIN